MRIDYSPSFMIGGYERGGTTLLSELFRNNGFNSGFECGVLLCESPLKFKDYNPYYQMMLSGWDLSEESLGSACEEDFKGFYSKVFSSAFGDVNESQGFFDKTPAYMKKLGLSLYRASPIFSKAIIIYRDPRAIFFSWAKRAVGVEGVNEYIMDNIKALSNRYISYFNGCVNHFDNPDVLFIPFEEFVTREEEFLTYLSIFLGLKMKLIKRASKPKYGNVTDNKMDFGKVEGYSDVLSGKTQDIILNDTSIAARFFSDTRHRIQYSGKYSELDEKVKYLLSHFGLNERHYLVDGHYFEPRTYLFRYPDLVKHSVNPVEHFRKHGINEGREGC
ncbi:sulfotransferase [Saccharospirillum salsuginis]|uniref:Sulfotransferase family protein n=1 Tax=Saccharospirillum salsuginis TaxID=418750 RepID=A0A918KE56_9GAMM|nr:sulfotransferase [Saccharospirillum salsuginis]GGX60210.1 hypothetical protein GCM10007392_30290 [Saccharospirillum salsuginis]